MNLKLKFNLVFARCSPLALVVAGGIVYRLVLKNAQAEVVHDARRMMDVALAVRDYTVTPRRSRTSTRCSTATSCPRPCRPSRATETIARLAKA